MKASYAFYLLVLLPALAQAQNNIIGLNPTIWNTGDGTTYVNAHVDILNTGNSTIDVLVERKSQVLIPGHESNFCWGSQCYPPFISLSPIPEPIPPATINQTFKGQLNPNGIAGLSRVTYCFFNQSNVLDSVCFEFFYDITLGLNEFNNQGSFLSSPSPNPARHLTALSYRIDYPQHPVKLVINNLNGVMVQEIPMDAPARNVILDISQLPAGFYLCSLLHGRQVIRTVKLIINR